MRSTIAIGIGKAGIRTLRELADLVEQEGSSQAFKYIAIDTNSNDLYDFKPGDAEPQHLDRSDDHWEEDANSYTYLTPELDFDPGEGTDRQRAVSRYYLDDRNNLPEIYNYINDTISDFVKERGRTDPNLSDINIWILNSLGGGTGSGGFPLITGIVYRITNQSEYDFFIGGLGSLPRLDGYLPNDIGTPDANADYYANAYTGLRELRNLMNIDQKEDHYPIELELEAGVDLGAEHITIPENPFDKYFLLGFDEERESRSYRRRMNTVAADLIYYLANVESAENHPDNQTFDGESLFAVNSVEVEAPIDELEDYVRLDEDIDSLEDDIDELDSEIEAINNDIQYLEELSQLRLEFPNLPNNPEKIDQELVRQLRNEVQNLDPPEVEGGRFDLDEKREQLRNSHEKYLPGDCRFDVSLIVSSIYLGYLYQNVREIVEKHRFKEYIGKFWREYKHAYSDNLKYYEESPPIDKWENGMEEELIDLYNQIDQEISSLNKWNIRKKRRLRNQKQELEKHINALQTAFDEYSALRELREEIDAKSNSINNNIQEAEKELKETRDQLKTEKREKEDNKHELEGQRHSDRKVLNGENAPVLPGRSSIPFQDLETLTDDIVNDMSSLGDLVDKERVDRNKLAKELNLHLNNLKDGDPVHDRTDRERVGTNSILAVLSARENIDAEGPAGDLLKLQVPQGKDLDNLTSEFDYYDPDETVELRGNKFVIRLLAMYADLSFNAMSEYGVMHELYTDDDRHVGELLGGEYSDDLVTKRFAYPELTPESERIKEVFTD